MIWSIFYKIKYNTTGVKKTYQTCKMERAAIASEDEKLLLNKRSSE